MIEGFREFEFDLPEALLARLIVAFDEMESAPLRSNTVIELPEEQGVYQLFHEGKLVYIGKTDAEQGLRQRLGRHAWTMQHRNNLDESLVGFRALRVFVFTAIDLESQLLKHYGRKAKVAWNNSGFGSNDPGRERDTTKLKAGGFDQMYPVDLDRGIQLVEENKSMNGAKALDLLRSAVPYTIRAQLHSKKTHPDLQNEVHLQSGLVTAREVITGVVNSLPPGWQATLLPGRVILYHESKDYSAGAVIARSELA